MCTGAFLKVLTTTPSQVYGFGREDDLYDLSAEIKSLN